MKKDPEKQDPFQDLRRWAENRVRQERREETAQPVSMTDLQKLVHELQVHQIELEMQNEELTRSRQENEAGYRKYEDLYDFSPVGYFTWDERGAIIEVNLAGSVLLGLERLKLIGVPFHAFVLPKFHPAVNHFIKTIFAEKTKAVCEVELAKKGKDPTFVRIEGMISESDRETRKQCRVVVMDITEWKLTEQQLRQYELKFRELFNHMKSGVAVYEATDDGNDFLIKDFNRAAETIERIAKEKLIGKSIRDIFPGVDEFGLFTVLQDVWKTGVPQHYPVERYRDGRIEGWRENYVYKLPTGEVVAIYEDLTERKKMEEEIRLLAITDALTGLYNRRGFITLAEQQMRTANRTGTKLMLLFIDIDGMKRINDTWGHKEGDQALVTASEILRQTFRESDIVARIGGDEFAVLAIDIVEPPETVLKRLTDRISSSNLVQERQYKISMSIGTAIYDSQTPCSVDELMSRADEAMYEEKRRRSLRTVSGWSGA